MTGFEPLVVAATAGLTSLITDVIKKTGGELLERLDRNLPTIRDASRQYIKAYTERHGSLKVACVRMDESMQLDQLYVAVQLLNRSELPYYESITGLQNLYRNQGKRGLGLNEKSKQDGIEAANQEQFLMVLGGPGVGKSTLLRKIGLEAIKGRTWEFKFSTMDHQTGLTGEHIEVRSCIPVLITLQRSQALDIRLEQLIYKEFEACDFPDSEAFAKAMLKEGRLMLLLDGLDEVPSQYQNYIINQIQDLVDCYSKNRFVVSCRIAAYKGGFPRFKDVAMSPFDEGQIKQFIYNWFSSTKDKETKTAKQCWELIIQPEYAAARELAQTPLLLTLLCAVYDKALDFPRNRSVLYGEALDILLKEWSAEKRIQRDPIYQELSIELERELLADIAYDSFIDDQLFFGKRDVTSRIREFLVNNLNAPKSLDSERVLEAIEVQQGILVERARDVYSFSHLTFQEYLTAQYIIDNEQIDWLIGNLSDRRWREVFLLVSGLVPGRERANYFLLLIEEQILTYVDNRRLKSLLKWAEDVTTEPKSPAKRSVAITLLLGLILNTDIALVRAPALVHLSVYGVGAAYQMDADTATEVERYNSITNVLTDALNLSNTFIPNLRLICPASPQSEEITTTITQALSQITEETLISRLQEFQVFKPDVLMDLAHEMNIYKSQIFTAQQTFGVFQNFAQEILLFWFKALGVKSETIDFFNSDLQALGKYLYANQLLIQCKEAAVRVSPQVWEKIDEKMLTVQDVKSSLV